MYNAGDKCSVLSFIYDGSTIVIVEVARKSGSHLLFFSSFNRESAHFGRVASSLTVSSVRVAGALLCTVIGDRLLVVGFFASVRSERVVRSPVSLFLGRYGDMVKLFV